MMKVVLIGCGKTKAKGVRPQDQIAAKDYYVSELFRRRMAYAQAHAQQWFIISAQYGCLFPGSLVRPYDLSAARLNRFEKAVWVADVAHAALCFMDDDGRDPRKITIEIHAGASYCEPLSTVLRTLGFQVELPCKGLGIGKQLAFYGSLSQATSKG